MGWVTNGSHSRTLPVVALLAFSVLAFRVWEAGNGVLVIPLRSIADRVAAMFRWM